MKIKTGDTVKIVRGKDSGKSGKVEKVMPLTAKVVVEGMNQYKRHLKSRMPGQKSEIITLTKPLAASNVQLVCPKCKKPTRVGYKMLKGDKSRICKKCKHEFA